MNQPKSSGARAHAVLLRTNADSSDNVQLKALRLPQVIEKSGLCRSAIYAKAAAGEFPAPFKLGNSKASAWWDHEVDLWLRGLLNAQTKGGN